MKGNNNFSRKFNGQIQTMGKGGIKNLSNSNIIQPKNSSSKKKNQQKQNVYQINNNNSDQINKKGVKQRNNYEVSKNQNNMNNNRLIRNAQMILNNNINSNNKRLKAKSAKKSNNINNLNNRYQGAQINSNYNISNNNIKKNSNKQIISQMYNKEYSSNSKRYNNNSNIKLKNKNNDKLPIMNKILNKSKDYQYIEFHPYSLKDYKELTRNQVIMGPLGPNIGTKDWESRRNRMKKMKNYSNNINKEHKGIVSLKKDSPQDEIEKLIKERIENGSRHKAFEYGKLVRAGKFKDDENNGKNPYDNYGGYPETDNDLYLKKYEDQLRQETENIYNPKPIEPPPVEEKVEPKNVLDIDQLLKQKEAYKNKIKDIRDTLLD